MIAVQEIVNRLNSALDSEGFDTYLFDNDFKPAINYAQQWLGTLFNAAFEKDKKVGEALKDLLYVSCFLTSNYSRVFFDETQVQRGLWSILHVYPEIQYQNMTGDPIPPALNGQSLYLPFLSYLKSYQSATLLTKDKVNVNRNNPFEKGNEYIGSKNLSSEFNTYVWVNHTKYGEGLPYFPFIVYNPEIEILPALVNKIIAIEYLASPPAITSISDNVLFPHSLMNLIVEKALEWMALKQPGTGYREGVPLIKTINAQDVSNLISLII